MNDRSSRPPAITAALGIGLVALSALLAGCQKEAEAPAPRPVVRPVKTMVLPDPSALLGLSFPGTVRATHRVDLAFEVPGTLTELPAKQGQRVGRRELLARLDPRDYEARVKAARAEYDKALANFKRADELVKKDFISRADYDQTIARRDITAAELAKAGKALADTSMRAPFEGVVARRFVENFQDVQAKQPVLSLQDTRRLEIVVDAPENLVVLARDRVRVKLAATFSALPGREFPVSVKEFATEADPVTQTYEYVLALPEITDANVLPGMSADVTIEALEGEGGEVFVYALPEAAVVREGEVPYVWVIEPGTNRAVRRTVVADEPDSSGQVAVHKGIEAGEVIATAGVHHLKEGMQVKPITAIRY
jgi:multidrug efflux system membrane fusion protein